MKKILLFAILLAGLPVFAQYEDEIKILNYICDSSDEDLNGILDSLEYEHSHGLHIYSNYDLDYFYTAETLDGKIVANYIEPYKHESIRVMGECINNASQDYHYRVSSFKKLDVIVITSTRK